MTRSFARALPALLLLALMMASGNVAFGVFPVVQEGAKAELGLSDVQLGLLQGLATSIPLALVSIPFGLLVDKVHRVRLLAATAMVWTAGTLLTAWAPDVATLFAARVLAGLGANVSTTIAISIVADLTMPAVRGRSLLLLTIGKFAGNALAFALGGWLLGRYAGAGGWRAVHATLGIASAALILPLLLLREPARQEVAAGAGAPVRVVAAELWARRAFLLPLFLGQTGALMADAAAVVWASPVLQRVYGVAPAEFAGWMGGIVFLASIAGALIGGVAADLGNRSARRGGLLVGAVVAAGVAVPAALFPIMPGTAGFGTALGVLLFGGTITGLVTATAIAVLLPNELRGLCIGAFIAFGGLIAFGLSPVLVTGTSRWLGGEGQLGNALALVGLIVSIMAVTGFFVAMRHAPASVRDEPV